MTETPEAPNAAAVKMRLRPQPRPVVRLSRKMLIGLGTTGGIGLAAALAVAIVPQKAKPAAADPAQSAPAHAAPSTEALNGLPKDYTGVPKLGPPLPGDFGKPILAAQQNAAMTLPGGAGDPVAAVPRSEQTPQPPAESQAAQVRTAAHASQLFFAHSTAGDGPTRETQPAVLDPGLASLASLAQSQGSAPEAKSEPDRKRAFLDQSSDRQPVSSERLTDPASPYILQTGSVVPAALITGIRSDIPGQVLAQVTEDVRDSLTGRYVLIPKGSRLVGQYDNAVSFGQSRLLLTWSRLVLPNGKSLILDKLSAADARGYAGLQDETDYHWTAIVDAAAVSTLLGIGTLTGDTKNDSALLRAIRDGAADSTNRAGQAIVERQLNVQPTLTIRPGLPVRVILSRDLVLEPYGETSWPN